MSLFSRIDRHAGLVSRMAEHTHAELDQALISGALTPEGYRRAVFACTGCSDPDRCEARLAAGEPGIPEFCRNAGLFEALTAEHLPT